jgi:recombinational DNA repair ATPase RecF
LNNLFLGKNSVGKTALLEAFYIYLHENKTEAIYELLLKKEEHLSQKCLLRNVHSANAAHTLLTFFLFIK